MNEKTRNVEAERQLAEIDEPRFVARLVPAGLDRGEIEETAAGVKATARLSELTREILDHVLDEDAGAPGTRDLDELHRRLDATWNDWRAAAPAEQPA